LVLADWNAYSLNHPEWMVPDGVHVNATGAFALANFIVASIKALTPARCAGDSQGDPSGPPTVSTAETAPPGKLTPSAPKRFVDTRAGATGSAVPNRLTANTPVKVKVAGVGGVPANATAVSFNLTAVEPDTDVYVTAYPCASSPPLVSNVNALAGTTVANDVV